MRKVLAKHAATTTGTLSCFDRLLCKGHLPRGDPHATEVFLTLRGVLVKDLKAFVLKQAERLKAHAQTMAARAGRPYEYCDSPGRILSTSKKLACTAFVADRCFSPS